MIRENITWRTFDDSGAINDQWNRPATPAFYIIDHHGVIRRKWIGKPGEKTVDAALEKLIGEAENVSLPNAGVACCTAR
jgi:hypothetical protein